jgi:subtilisin family serine protease
VADGIRYVFRVAGESGRPAVVNLSLGGQADAHDGTDALSAFVDAESGPGRIVCCAAGNEGTVDIHARVGLQEDCVSTVTFTLPPSPGGVPGPSGPFRAGDMGPSGPFRAGDTGPSVTLQGWYPGVDALEVAVAGPSGLQTPFQAVLADGSPVRTYQLPEADVRVVTPGPDPSNGDHNFLVEVQPSAGAVMASGTGAWRIRLRGVRVTSGVVDVWAISQGWAAQFSGPSVAAGLKVGTPGAAAQAVTVGSYTTKVEWADLMGGGHQVALALGEMSDFSSPGPRRDGAGKPDLAAPGAMIVSSLSADTPVLLDVLIDGWHQIMAGTSMAAPFVSGVVALLLERDPDLDPGAVKQLLTGHCSIPDQDPGAFDPTWGHGLIDVGAL